nr:hypothetical protein [Tanacetum cinerariifolium]
MRPFGCPVNILNTKDHLGQFDGKADEGFFVGYLLNSKAFRVFNRRTRIMEENFHIRFSENTPNVVGSGPYWLFDIDALTRTINYEPIVVGTQSNGFACTKASDNACQTRKETEPIKDYILLLLWTADPTFSQDPVSSQDDGFKPSRNYGNKVDDDPRKENECNNQEKEDTVSSTINAAGTNEVNVVAELPFDPDMPTLEDVGTFDFSNEDEDDDAVANMNNLDTTIQVSPTPTIRIHTDHPLDQVIIDLHSTTQTRQMLKNLEEHGFVSTIQQRTNHKDLQNCLFACFLSQEEPKKMDVKSALFYGKIEESVLQVKQKKDGIFISQDKYVAEIIKKFRFTKVKNANTPMETQTPMLKDEDVCASAKYQVNIKVSHLYAVKRIFKYLKGQPKLSLWYLKDSPFDLVAYTDSDYAGASLDRKSTTGENPTESEGFGHIVDFLSAHILRYALTVNPTIYDSCIEQFWSTAMAKTIHGKAQIHAWVDGKEIIITKSSVRRDLRLEDDEGVDCLLNSTIFENLELMGITNLFPCMLVRNLMGEGSTLPTDPQHTLTILQLSSSQPQKTQKPRKPKRKNTQVPQSSGSTENVTDEAVYKELDDRLVRAATTASSLAVKQDSGNIDKTLSKPTPNEASSLGTTSGGGPKCQEAMGDKIAKAGFENMSKLSNDSLLARGNTLQSDKDRMKLNELMELCTNLQSKVLYLDKTKTTQVLEITSLKRRVEKFKKKQRSRTHKLKGLYKVGLTARCSAITTTEEIALAQALVKIKTTKPKAKGIVLQEPSESITTTTISLKNSQDKGKAIMIKEPVKLKKNDQIRLDEEVALRLQAEFDDEERLAREKA